MMSDDEAAKEFSEIMREMQEENQKYHQKIAQELNVSEDVAVDVAYLRTRSRWTEELEKELIALHAAGTPPNMCDFGCTEASRAKMQQIVDEVSKKYE